MMVSCEHGVEVGSGDLWRPRGDGDGDDGCNMQGCDEELCV